MFRVGRVYPAGGALGGRWDNSEMNKNIYTGEGGNDPRVEEAQPARDRSRSRTGRGADAATGGEAATGGTAGTSRGRSTVRRGGRGGAGGVETRRTRSDVSQHAAEIGKAAEGREEDPLRRTMGLIDFRPYGGRAPGGEGCEDRSGGGDGANNSGASTSTGAGGSRRASALASRGASGAASPAPSTESSRGRVRFAGGPSESMGEDPDHREGLSGASSQASGLNEGDVPLEKRGRGRPEKTGEHRLQMAEKARKEEAAANKAAGETVLRMRDPAIPPAEGGKGAKKVDETEIRNELAGKTVEEMAGILAQRMDSVDKGAQGSRNLKGTIAHEIKKATVEARVIAQAMVFASAGSALPPAEREATGQMKENKLLRTEVAALKESLRELQKKVEQQEEELAGGGKVPGQKRRRRTPTASVRTGESESDASPDRMECGADPTWRPAPGEEEWLDALPAPTPLALRETTPATPSNQPGGGLTRAEVKAMMADMMAGMMAGIREELAVLRVTLRGPSGRPATTPPVTGRGRSAVPSSSSVPLAAPQEASGAAQGTGRRKKKKKKKGGTGQGLPPAKAQPPRGAAPSGGGGRADRRPPSRGPEPRGAPPRPRSKSGARGRGVSRAGRGRGDGGGRPPPPPAATGRDRAPPPPPRASEPSWSEVVGRREGQRRRERSRARKAPPPPPPPQKKPPSGRGGVGDGPRRAKVPRAAAIVLTCPEGGYMEVMGEVRKRISLADLRIEGVSVRRALTGALVLEVGGEGSKEKADALASRMSGVLAGREGVKISRPEKTADLQVQDLEDSVSGREVAEAVARAGGCDVAAVRAGEIRRGGRGLGTAVVACPVAAANRVAAAGKMVVGWTKVRVVMLEPRPLRCYRCLGRGHVGGVCPSAVDRSGLCHRCGGAGHIAKNCGAPARCVVCEEAGRPAGHVAGGRACPVPSRRAAARARNGAAGRKPAQPRPAPSLAPAPNEGVSPPPMSVPGEESPPADVVMTPAGKRPRPEEAREDTPPPPLISVRDWPGLGEPGYSGWEAPKSSGAPATPLDGDAALAGVDPGRSKRPRPAHPEEGGRSSPSSEAGVEPCRSQAPSQ